jgi:hypothetical protein
MIATNSLLFGIVAALITLKVVLLAAAAVLFVFSLTERIRQRQLAHAPAPVKHRRLHWIA